MCVTPSNSRLVREYRSLPDDLDMDRLSVVLDHLALQAEVASPKELSLALDELLIRASHICVDFSSPPTRVSWDAYWEELVSERIHEPALRERSRALESTLASGG